MVILIGIILRENPIYGEREREYYTPTSKISKHIIYYESSIEASMSRISGGGGGSRVIIYI